MSQNKSTRTYVFIICFILWIILAGVLIYLCIYLTEYSSNHSNTTLTSAKNHTTSAHQVKTVSIPLDDTMDDDDNDTSSVPVLKKALISSLVKVEAPSLTKVTIPRNAIKKVIYRPEEITLQNVKR